MRVRARWPIAGVAVAGVVSLGAYLARPYPTRPVGPGVTWDNAERIQPGMSAAEVERIVGMPPQAEFPDNSLDREPPGCHRIMMWSDMECDILVYLDQNRRAIRADAVPARPAPPSWSQRLRRRLGL